MPLEDIRLFMSVEAYEVGQHRDDLCAGGLNRCGVLPTSVSESYPNPYAPHQTVMIIMLPLFAWVI
jgi:hypothetical protein